jgi:hypothetical protein
LLERFSELGTVENSDVFMRATEILSCKAQYILDKGPSTR